VASKINTAISWLLNQFPLSLFWELNPEDNTEVQPLDDRGIKAPSIQVGGEAAVGSFIAGENVRVESDGKMYIDDLAVQGVNMPLLVDPDGRVRTALTVDTWDLTFNFTIPTSGLEAILPSLSGTLFLTGPALYIRNFSAAQNISVEGIEAGTYSFSFSFEGYMSASGEVTVEENKTVSVTVHPLPGVDPESPPETRKSLYTKDGTSEDFSREVPNMIVERDENYTLSLPDAIDNKDVEFTARKAKAGGALTVAGGVLMDGEENDVLTATEKGAWAIFKSVLVWDDNQSDYVRKWVVTADSGHWTLDNI